MDYVFTEGTASPYNVKYDDVGGSGPFLVSTSEAADSTALNTQRKLIRLSDGTLYAVYPEQLDAKYQIYVSKSEDDGETWTDETRVSVNATKHMEDYDQTFPSIAVDSEDNLHVVWEGYDEDYSTRAQVWYAKYDGSWSTPLRLSTIVTTYDSTYPAIAVDSSDYLHVVFGGRSTPITGRVQIQYTKYDGSWSAPVRISTADGMDDYNLVAACIAVDSNDYLHVLFIGRADGYTSYDAMWYTKYDGSWSVPSAIFYTTGSQSYPSIAIDSSDNLHVVWSGKTGLVLFHQVWYMKYDGSWPAEPTMLSTATGMEDYGQAAPTIAVDADDNLHVVWQGKIEVGGGPFTDWWIWYVIYTDSWATPAALHSTGNNIYPNIRWSRWPG